MANPQIQSEIEKAVQQAVGEIPSVQDGTANPISITSYLVRAGDIVAPWYSKYRDRQLFEFVVQSNHLAIAVYNSVARMVGIPFEIVPQDRTDPSLVELAREFELHLKDSAGFYKSWLVEYSKFVQDLLCTDNGAFMEVIGGGRPDGKLIGPVTAVRHLDSLMIDRTGDPIFPVVYNDPMTGKRYFLHFTRVIMMSQLPSTRVEMNEVGLCAVSRSIMVAQNLLDISRYKQERLGSRPLNQILVGKGLTAGEIQLALAKTEADLSSMGFARYGKTVAIGSKSTEIGLERIDLNHMEPFDEEISVNLGMYAIAAAFGMDASELWPASGGSGADEAELRRMRSRGRLPAQLTSELSQQFRTKILPRGLTLRFDFRDDAEDMQQANVRDIRGRNRERDLNDQSLTIRTARLNMVNDGDITPDMFEEMELADGHLPDGRSLDLLFVSNEPVYRRYLTLGGQPLLYSQNDPDEMLSLIEASRADLLSEWAKTTSLSKETQLRRAFYALQWIEKRYQKESDKKAERERAERMEQRLDGVPTNPDGPKPEPKADKDEPEPGKTPSDLTGEQLPEGGRRGIHTKRERPDNDTDAG